MEQPTVNKVLEKTKNKYAGYDSQKNRERIDIMMVQARQDQHNTQWNIDSEFTPVIGAGLGHIQDKVQHNIKQASDHMFLLFGHTTS